VLEQARRIKQDPELSGTLIMMLSSGDRPGDPAACEELDIAACLVKPIKQSELLDAIMLAVGGAAVESSAADVPGESRSPAIRPLHILLVEDSLVNQKLAVGLLTKYGHEVEVAGNGLVALELSKRTRYDVVLMDVQMPEMDGLETTKVIRARERQSGGHIPIIAMTAHAMKGDRERCLEAGMDDYIAKPIRRRELFDAIGRAVSAAPGEVGHESAGDGPPMSASPPSVINWAAALEVAGGDEQLLRELAATCLSESANLLAQSRAAVDAGDHSTLLRTAHTLKGQLRIFGTAIAEHLAFHIENTARDGSVSVAEPLVRLQREIDQMHAELREFLAGRIAIKQLCGGQA
jgi:CheY-like chemotaxis protein/HPt (histidine-containing phosphotransfer) domain-containing protein